MIIGVGLDVVAVARLERALRKDGAVFAERVFTAAERQACEGRADGVQALAARFAAKEAFFKALGAGWRGGGGGSLALHQVEVIAAASGKPELRLSGATADQAGALGVKHVHVTLTHEPEYAAAVVILEA